MRVRTETETEQWGRGGRHFDMESFVVSEETHALHAGALEDTTGETILEYEAGCGGVGRQPPKHLP